MCGICGGFYASGCCAAPEPAAVLRSIAHRGPDGVAHVSLSPRSFVGFSRLSLVGAAQQPLIDGERALVCNGEIYNYAELQLSLSAQRPAASAAGKVALMRLFRPAARCSDEGNGGCGVDWGWERIRDLLTRLPPVGSVGESWRVLFQM